MEVTVLECVTRGDKVQFVRTVVDGAVVSDRARLFLATASAMTSVVQLMPGLANLAPGKDKTNIDRAFAKVRDGGCGYVRYAYTSKGQMERSASHQLGKLIDAQRRIVCFIQVPDEMYATITPDAQTPAKLASAFRDGLGSPVSQYLNILPPVTVPAFLEKEYVGNSDSVKFVRRMIVLAARQADPVLILGDTGTGKEIVATMVHRCRFGDTRAEFIAVNCSSIPGSLFESELFGHMKGAFTGAHGDREGLWAAAKDGTLFLDEVGELPLESQAKILRAIETKKIKRVGADTEESVAAHLVMATNQELFAMTRRGTFREDLYFRIRDNQIPTPPLRQHPEDIPLLANHLWALICNKAGATLPADATECLAEYPWPGNVRELRNVLAKMHQWYVGVPIESRSQVEFIMALVGQPVDRFYRTERILTKAARAAAQLKHTRKTQEALIAARLLLEQAQSCGDAGAAVRAGLPRQLLNAHRDLAALCESPLAFGSDKIFRAVHEFIGELGQFLFAIDENADALTGPAYCRELLLAIETISERIENHATELMNATRS
ncbi:MAG: sigma 54-interacting transcriptional regulator [Candidatus Hydrogenedentes bacterium]|nr:sigma 54-interacting transcriptional regulator [Candidatus Hydrogenedentota bacterium]